MYVSLELDHCGKFSLSLTATHNCELEQTMRGRKALRAILMNMTGTKNTMAINVCVANYSTLMGAHRGTLLTSKYLAREMTGFSKRPARCSFRAPLCVARRRRVRRPLSRRTMGGEMRFAI